MKGLFIVIYGVNNLGKSTQARLLVERMNTQGHKTRYLKYPLYDIEPSGPFINDYLRLGNTHALSPREFQLMNVFNRMQYDTALRNELAGGMHVVAENYTGSGIAWGEASGMDRQFLERLNSPLLQEDMAFLFDGERFTHAVESSHIFETDNELTKKTQEVYRDLAEKNGWTVVHANDTIESIHERIWTKVHETLKGIAK